MRISPFIVWAYFKYKNNLEIKLDDNNILDFCKEIADEVEKDTSITHIHPIVKYHAAWFTILGLMALKGENIGTIRTTITTLFTLLSSGSSQQNVYNNGNIGFAQLLEFIYEIDKDDNKNDILDKFFNTFSNGNYTVYQSQGYVLHAIRMMLFLIFNINDWNQQNLYRDIIYAICDYGGDTDTNAAIVGAIAGPLCGGLKQMINNDSTIKSFYEQMFNLEAQLEFHRIKKYDLRFCPAIMVKYVECLETKQYTTIEKFLYT